MDKKGTTTAELLQVVKSKNKVGGTSFRGISLYGSNIISQREESTCKVFHIKNETGTARYPATLYLRVWSYSIMTFMLLTVIISRLQQKTSLRSITAGKGGMNAASGKTAAAIWRKEIWPLVH